MNFRKKTSNVTKVLYIILAMCIVSIIALTLYSLFNQGDGQLNIQSLHNEVPQNNQAQNNREESAEDALANIFRRQEETTEAGAEPPEPPTSRQTPAAATQPPVITSGATPPATSVIRQEAPPLAPTTTAAPPAFNPEDELEESVEVISVPSAFRRPLNGFISKLFSPVVPQFSVTMNDYRTHMGISIDGEIGSNVRAAADGIVTEIRDDPLMGKTVIISHANGISSAYMNLQTALPQNIAVGAQVKSGDVIGGVGQTSLIGSFDVPHLYFEMIKDGIHVDPLDYIDFS